MAGKRQGGETVTLQHSTLGPLHGLARSSSVAQFRGIPFASIPARFRQCVPIDDLTAEQRDCTEFGYACSQNPQDLTAYGGPLPGEGRKYDESECLNLTVTAPRAYLDGGSSAGKKIPVMVYVHGGAFREGVHSTPIYDQTRMVELSVQEGMPVVMVAIHYRLNWLGFLACQDLIDEAARLGEPACNFGLRDQRAAFLWIQKHISDFGGDASDITAFGESAGSVSLWLHLCSTEPLFKRAALLSGTAVTCKPIDLPPLEKLYLELLDYCGIDRHDPDRLKRLREDVPVQKMLDAMSALRVGHFNPLAESTFFPEAPTYYNQADIVGRCTWIKEIIIGDTFFEGAIFTPPMKNIPVKGFVAYLGDVLGADGATKILDAYHITPEMDANLFWSRLLVLTGDLTFSAPIHAVAKAFAAQNGNKSAAERKKLYRYHTTVRNPFPGSIFSEMAGHHFVELLFLFMTLMERFPMARQRTVSLEFAKRWIRFGNGLSPWPEYQSGEETIAIVDSRLGWVTRTREEDVEQSKESEEGQRRYHEWEVIASVFEGLGSDRESIVESLNAVSILNTVY